MVFSQTETSGCVVTFYRFFDISERFILTGVLGSLCLPLGKQPYRSTRESSRHVCCCFYEFFCGFPKLLHNVSSLVKSKESSAFKISMATYCLHIFYFSESFNEFGSGSKSDYLTWSRSSKFGNKFCFVTSRENESVRICILHNT